MRTDPNTITAARLLAEIREVRGCHEKTTRHLDSMVSILLSLSNDELAGFGNHLGPQEMNDLLAAHAAQCVGVATLADMAEAVVAAAEGRDPIEPRRADSRPFADKLAEQYRAIVFDGVSFSVVDLERPPEPELPTDPAGAALAV